MSARRPRIAINGFGRIGRAVARIAALDPNCPFDLVAANDLTDPGALAYLLRYDSAHGRFHGDIASDGNTLKAGHQTIQFVAQPDPAKLPWGELGVDVVIESTGKFRKRSDAQKHIAAGAKKVILSAPGETKDEAPDLTVIRGINCNLLKPEHTLISAASCTTTCLAPMAKALHRAVGIESGVMSTVHAYTADQVLVDTPHKKEWRRGRTAAVNIVPTTTGAAKAIGLVVPELQGRLHGVSLRVPVQDVSLVDLVCQVRRDTTIDEVNQIMRTAAAAYLPGTFRVEDQLVVSGDLLGDGTGSVFDPSLTHVQNGKLVKIVAWYDNEWGYASRLYALTSFYASL
ncbi:MAG: type I glyceraldehyde-3-phosphate dehydrogenase [Deltaproteobacteria bacterium]|nr:type I glyceraldehyde-3-phosphate dehydrogenase [Deltaproteobacteria bacterium]